MLPDLVAGNVSLVGTLHDPFQGFIVVAVELGEFEAFGALFDQGVEVIGLFEVEIVLPVVRVGGNELPTDGFMDFTQNGLNLGEQIIGRIAAQFLYAGLIQAESVAELLGRRT